LLVVVVAEAAAEMLTLQKVAALAAVAEVLVR
jgi:hypothetical protein